MTRFRGAKLHADGRQRLPHRRHSRISAVPIAAEATMPIKLPSSLPAFDVLSREGVMVMSEDAAA
ncbi:MAG: hypothetical protein AAFP67_12620, partial [Pseudomonadota bacterium]